MEKDLDRSGKRKEHSWMAAREWPEQHLGADGRMVWKRESPGVKESVWMLVTSSKRVMLRA